MSEKTVMLDCDEILDITRIQEWHAAAVEQVGDLADDLNIQVSSLQKIDTAGIQALLSVVKYVEAKGGRVIWSELSPAFINAATLLGLAGSLRITPASL